MADLLTFRQRKIGKFDGFVLLLRTAVSHLSQRHTSRISGFSDTQAALSGPEHLARTSGSCVAGFTKFPTY